MQKMTREEVDSRLAGLPGWGLDGAGISRQWAFPSFADAMAFVVRLGFEAEAADHHPDIHIDYKRVKLTYWTHTTGGLTLKDFEGAAAANRLAAASAGGER